MSGKNEIEAFSLGSSLLVKSCMKPDQFGMSFEESLNVLDKCHKRLYVNSLGKMIG